MVEELRIKPKMFLNFVNSNGLDCGIPNGFKQ